MNKPRQYMAAHWVGGIPEKSSSMNFLSTGIWTEGELFRMMSETKNVDVFSVTNTMLAAVCTTDDIIERLMAK